MKHIASLELSDQEWPHRDELFRALLSDTPPLLPKLKHLTLSQCQSEQLTDEILSSLFSRAIGMEGASILQSFCLMWPDGADPVEHDDHPQTRKLLEVAVCGTEIHVGTPSVNFLEMCVFERVHIPARLSYSLTVMVKVKTEICKK
jgi:hypothetical protein